MELKHSVAVVTGGSRGLGRHLAAQLLDRGASVYVAARHPEVVDLPGVRILHFDLTDPASVCAAADVADDATLLINNAGISTRTSLIDGDLDKVRAEMEANFFGALAVTRTFVPVIEGNGGGAILNVLSVLSWRHTAEDGAYNAAKAAEWSMTDSVRQELAPRGIEVSSLVVGYMDTEMFAYVDRSRKVDPAAVATAALDGIEAGMPEILADRTSHRVKESLATANQP